MIGTELRLSFAQATPEHMHPFVISVFWTSRAPFVLLQETEKYWLQLEPVYCGE